MALTGLKKRLQTGNEDKDRKLIKSVLDIINSMPDEQTESETGSGGKTKSPEDKRKIVLHIDDDAEDRDIVHNAIKLADPSIIIHQVESGKSGIEFLNKAKSFGHLPCLIILDLNMPGMNGFDTYNEIKKDEALKSLSTVIFTTAAVFRQNENKGNEHLPIFIKPDSSRAFNITIKAILAHCCH